MSDHSVDTTNKDDSDQMMRVTVVGPLGLICRDRPSLDVVGLTHIYPEGSHFTVTAKGQTRQNLSKLELWEFIDQLEFGA